MSENQMFCDNLRGAEMEYWLKMGKSHTRQ